MQGGIWAFCEAVVAADGVKDVRCRLGPTQPKCRVIKGRTSRVPVSEPMDPAELEEGILDVLEAAAWGQVGKTAMRIDAHAANGRAISGLTHSETRIAEVGTAASTATDAAHRGDLVGVLLNFTGSLTNALNENCRVMRQNAHSVVGLHQDRNAMLTRRLEVAELELVALRQSAGVGDPDEPDAATKAAAADMFSQVVTRAMGGGAGITPDTLVDLIKKDPASAAALLADARVTAAIDEAMQKAPP